MRSARENWRTRFYAAIAALFAASLFCAGCAKSGSHRTPAPSPGGASQPRIAPAPASPQTETPAPLAIPGEYIVYTADPESARRWADERGFGIATIDAGGDTRETADAGDGESAAALMLLKNVSGEEADTLEKLAGVFFASPRWEYRACDARIEAVRTPAFLPDDPLYVEARLDDTTEPPTLIPYQKTTLEPVSAEGAWDLSRAEGVKIAVVSSGVYEEHPDLDGRISPLSRAFAEVEGEIVESTNIADEASTVSGAIGTYLAGVIAANIDNNEGMAGIAPECELIVLKTGRVINAPGPTWAMNDLEARTALRYAADCGAVAVLLPYAVISTPQSQPLFESAITYCASLDTLVIVPAGDGSPAVDVGTVYPANSQQDNVISVGGLYIPATVRLPGSNFDAAGGILDMAAPAFALIATDSRPEDLEADPQITGYVYASGTAFAAALAAGTSGLMAGALGEAKFRAQPMAAALRQSVDSWEYLGSSDPFAGAGRLNMNRAVALAYSQVNIPAPLVIQQVFTTPSANANGTTLQNVYIHPIVLGGTPPYKVRVEWGDGKTYPPGFGLFAAYGTGTFSNAYESPGKYPVTIAFKDSAGQEKVWGLFYNIRLPLTATISATKSGVIPRQYLFKAVVANADVSSPSYKWDFDGNGTTDSTDQNPVYTYSASGEYTVRFQVTDSRGAVTRTMVLSVQ